MICRGLNHIRHHVTPTRLIFKIHLDTLIYEAFQRKSKEPKGWPVLGIVNCGFNPLGVKNKAIVKSKGRRVQGNVRDPDGFYEEVTDGIGGNGLGIE